MSKNNAKRWVIILLFFVFLNAGIFFYSQSKSRRKSPWKPKGSVRIAVVTYYYDDKQSQEFKRLFYWNKISYCRQKGYDLYDAPQVDWIDRKIEEERALLPYQYFFKYKAVLEIMKRGDEKGQMYDWIVWQDGDALFLNFRKSFEDIIDERFDMIVTTDWPDGGKNDGIINAGSFIIRNCEWSREFLEHVLLLHRKSSRYFLEIYPLANLPINGWLSVVQPKGYWQGDQGVLQGILAYGEEKHRSRIKQTYFRVFNSILPHWGPGDFVVHVAGYEPRSRKVTVQELNRLADFSTGSIDLSKLKYILYDPEHAHTSDLKEIEEAYKTKNIIVKS